jgi:hypothetical protein
MVMVEHTRAWPRMISEQVNFENFEDNDFCLDQVTTKVDVQDPEAKLIKII